MLALLVYMNYVSSFRKHIFHYADILAIPFFLLLSYYFSQIEEKTVLEWFLFLFAVSGFVLDTIFTLFFVMDK